MINRVYSILLLKKKNKCETMKTKFPTSQHRYLFCANLYLIEKSTLLKVINMALWSSFTTTAPGPCSIGRGSWGAMIPIRWGWGLWWLTHYRVRSAVWGKRLAGARLKAPVVIIAHIFIVIVMFTHIIIIILCISRTTAPMHEAVDVIVFMAIHNVK